MPEDEMTGWHHWLDGHEFAWTLGVGDRQGGLACCDSWGSKEPDMTEWLNWTELIQYLWASLVSQLVKMPPAVQETWVPSLDWEDPLEKGKAIHSSILAWRIPWTAQSMGVTKSRTQLSHFQFHFSQYLHQWTLGL